MSRYYNMTRGILVVALRDGSTASLHARAVIDLTADQDGSADILAKVRKGMLKKLVSAEVVTAAPKIEAPDPQIEVLVESVPQDLVEPDGVEVAEAPTSSVELESPQDEGGQAPEETPEDRRFGKHRRHGKHRS